MQVQPYHIWHPYVTEGSVALPLSAWTRSLGWETAGHRPLNDRGHHRPPCDEGQRWQRCVPLEVTASNCCGSPSVCSVPSQWVAQAGASVTAPGFSSGIFLSKLVRRSISVVRSDPLSPGACGKRSTAISTLALLRPCRQVPMIRPSRTTVEVIHPAVLEMAVRNAGSGSKRSSSGWPADAVSPCGCIRLLHVELSNGR